MAPSAPICARTAGFGPNVSRLATCQTPGVAQVAGQAGRLATELVGGATVGGTAVVGTAVVGTAVVGAERGRAGRAPAAADSAGAPGAHALARAAAPAARPPSRAVRRVGVASLGS
ncbi:unannotated protein [freshwater metagenome]|uniref:Unannotated protein n=1 Tax=freshwater metagenome TaxID=449393 RepID=A0A6J6ZCL7_9ZZZZ